MGKIIMASPKVIAVTFDQANSMKNKYIEFIKSNQSVAPIDIDNGEKVKEEPFNISEPVMPNTSSDDNQENISQVSSESDNIFSVTSSNSVPVDNSVHDLSSVVTNLGHEMAGITLTDAELKELEDGLIEVIKIAELSIHSIIEQYREKGKNKERTTDSQEPVVSEKNSESIFDTGSGNIFDNPGDGKSIA